MEARDRDRRHGKAGSGDHHELARAAGEEDAGRRSAAASVATSAVSCRIGDDLGRHVGLAGGIDRHRGRGTGEDRRRDRRDARRRVDARRSRRRGSDDRELLADVDPDRAPGDAPAAADAARRSRTGPTTSRTCGSATGGSDPRPAAGSCPPATRAKPSVKQLSHVRSATDLDTVEVRHLRHAGAEAGRADERAVGARQASIGDLRPAWAVGGADEASGQAVGRDGVADPVSGRGHGGPRDIDVTG